jgi:hypothetical protein
MGSRPGKAYDVSCVRVCYSGNLYCLNQKLKIIYWKKQIQSEHLYRAHIECASQWQGMWLCVGTSINMKFCNMSGTHMISRTGIR